ncbi:MAG: class I mannose-6-phosphate isomerase [Firmicutes bacterium]|nr:class I mannose-6-phosphate isomerase [Bacillota bacterium]
MLYPLKFKPVYKDYLWGGRNLEKLGKVLPKGIVAESWEVSCHPDGESIIANGEFQGMPLSEYINKFQYKAMGKSLSWKPGDRFPLLVKLIDANNKLSVQVHPDDKYAVLHEEDKSGKNEMWYIISAKPGAKLIYGLKPGTTRGVFKEALENGLVEKYLNYIEVSEGDAINIPAGIIHAIGEGIVLAEVQQNSNNTYRVYDYNRVDKDGNKRPLHIQKALDVIDFSSAAAKQGKLKGITVPINNDCTVTYLVKNRYFSVELYDVRGEVKEIADGSRFCIYIFIEGEGTICYGIGGCLSGNIDEDDCNGGKNRQGIEYFNRKMDVRAGESIFIPADMGKYVIFGNIKAIKAYVPGRRENHVFL